ncbi:23S rRNA (pseudouridine(1915)-N(3))-methyltransferase RlmH [Candidatus Halobeggiatoa sp. HSG11]|nr:23S rRNA (pseudouridine(1915)-N(3))-methyltransferase RlmH [Candidatus Halobeggiatoa sp. HSG11]
MHIDLICVGQKMPTWVETGFQEYAKRLPNNYRLNLIQIPLQKRTKNSDLTRLQNVEGERMLAKVNSDSLVIALDEHGQIWDSPKLSTKLAYWLQEYSTVSLLVGGPEGLPLACQQRANQQWSLSKLTLPHQLVKIIVAEQLYRAWSMLNNHPYHRV